MERFPYTLEILPAAVLNSASESPEELTKMEITGSPPRVPDSVNLCGAHEFAFSTGEAGAVTQGPHFENHWCRDEGPIILGTIRLLLLPSVLRVTIHSCT